MDLRVDAGIVAATVEDLLVVSLQLRDKLIHLIDGLLQLLNARISLSVKALIKCYSSKASKHKDSIQKWTQIDEFIAKTNASKRTTVYDKVNKICAKINSSKLLEASPQK